LIGKIVYWFFYSCIENAHDYIKADKETEQYIKDILNSMSGDKRFCEDAAKLVDAKTGITDSVANKIIKIPFVQRQINDKIEKNKFLKKSDLETGIKSVILKAWNNKTILEPAINKVKNEIK